MRPHFGHLSLLITSILCISSFSHADVRLPKILSDNAILQRDSRVTVWGWADDGEQVSVFIDGKKLAQTQSKNGDWAVVFKSLPAGGPHILEVRGNNSVKLNNVYFGDVWVASGQSNMQTPMRRVEPRFPEDVKSANYPLLREFTVPREFKFDGEAQDHPGGDWQATTPDSVLDHSAVGYYFGRTLQQSEQVPIGIIGANFGGSAAECWLSLKALEAYPDIHNKAVSYANAEYLQSLKDADKSHIDRWHADINRTDKGINEQTSWFAPNYNHSKWDTINVPGLWADQGIAPMSGVVWFRRTLELTREQASIANEKPSRLRLGTITDADTTYINGTEVGNTGYQYPPRRYQVAPGILKTGKNTLTIRVRIDNNDGKFVPETPYYLEIGDDKIDLTGPWYYKIGTITQPHPPRQFTPWNEPLGCYNAMLAPLFNMTIKGVIWYQGESNTGRTGQYEHMFPQLIQLWRDKWNQGDFPFLYVQLPNFKPSKPLPSESDWAELRFAQFKTLKKAPNTAMAVTIDVGEWNDLHPHNKRAVGERLALAARSLAYDHNIEYSGPLFKKAQRKKNTVRLSFTHTGGGLIAKGKGEALEGFAIAGMDGAFVWAKAKIVKNNVIVWHPDITIPKKVRYAWADNPDTANLYNKDGLPASPFEVEL